MVNRMMESCLRVYARLEVGALLHYFLHGFYNIIGIGGLGYLLIFGFRGFGMQRSVLQMWFVGYHNRR